MVPWLYILSPINTYMQNNIPCCAKIPHQKYSVGEYWVPGSTTQKTRQKCLVLCQAWCPSGQGKDIDKPPRRDQGPLDVCVCVLCSTISPNPLRGNRGNGDVQWFWGATMCLLSGSILVWKARASSWKRQSGMAWLSWFNMWIACCTSDASLLLLRAFWVEFKRVFVLSDKHFTTPNR